MKTFTEFQESVASLVLKGGIKVLPKIPGAVKALTSGTLTGLSLLQAKRNYDTKESRGRRKEKPKRKLSRMAQKQIEIENKRGEKVTKYDPTKGMIKPKPGEVRKTEAIIRKHEKANKVIKPKEGEAEKTQELINKYLNFNIGIKSKKPIVKPKLNKPENQFEDAIPTNNASSGNIAGLPPDDPPVKKGRKKKKYIYGGRGSRKMWMNNK